MTSGYLIQKLGMDMDQLISDRLESTEGAGTSTFQSQMQVEYKIGRATTFVLAGRSTSCGAISGSRPQSQIRSLDNVTAVTSDIRDRFNADFVATWRCECSELVSFAPGTRTFVPRPSRAVKSDEGSDGSHIASSDFHCAARNQALHKEQHRLAEAK